MSDHEKKDQKIKEAAAEKGQDQPSSSGMQAYVDELAQEVRDGKQFPGTREADRSKLEAIEAGLEYDGVIMNTPCNH